MASKTTAQQPNSEETLEALMARPVVVSTMPKRGVSLEFEADELVRAALQERFELIELQHFYATASLSHWKRGGVRVQGRVSAKLVQPCAVTGEPLATTVDETVDLTLLPTGSPLAVPEVADTGELILDPDGADLPEVFEGDSVDIGGYWLEHFALGFDPYARKEGASFNDIASELPLDTAAAESPFAALAALKTDDGSAS